MAHQTKRNSKHNSQTLRQIIVEIFNKCLKKSNENNLIKNYKPISITPCIMRLFDRIISNRLKQFVSENNLIIKINLDSEITNEQKTISLYLSKNNAKRRKKIIFQYIKNIFFKYLLFSIN
jgi:hypothetical protein